MKKILIGIIIILIILLIGQLVYFNFRNQTSAEDQESTANQNVVTTQNNSQNDETTGSAQNVVNLDQNTVSNSTQTGNEQTNTISPTGMSAILESYSGDIRLSQLEEYLYNFIYSDFDTIYNLTTRKSTNAILQLYDTNTTQINNMHIYSAEDLLNITSQIFMVGTSNSVNYTNSYIDLSTLNENENGYTTFYVTFRFSNQRTVELKVYIANSSSTVPNIRFGADEL